MGAGAEPGGEEAESPPSGTPPAPALPASLVRNTGENSPRKPRPPGVCEDVLVKLGETHILYNLLA